MKTFKQFLRESSYSKIQAFMITCWGRLLYLDYELLPHGPDQSKTKEFLKVIDDWNNADQDEQEGLDEWISEGGKQKDGTKLFSRETVDAVLHQAQHKALNDFDLYRFDHTPSKLRANSWISLTRKDTGYDGERSVFHIKAGTPIIDAHGLADNDEVIMNTTDLM
jgi:hypothetical protein